MKKVLAWIKAHLVPVVSVVLILVLLPVGFVVSTGWGKGIREARQEDAGSALSRIRSQESVTYTIPPILPGEEAIEQRAAPNTARTAWFQSLAESRQAEATRVVEETVAFNRRDRDVLVDGLFPEPASARQRQVKSLELAERVIGTDTKRSVYLELLESISAGPPADAQRAAQLISDFRDRELERHQSETGRSELDPAEAEELQSALTDRRIGEYQRVARSRSVYATPEVIHARTATRTGSTGRPTPGGRPTGGSAGGTGAWVTLPAEVPDQPPEIDEVFGWQFDYWVVEDILGAIDAANTQAGVRADVTTAAVKRIEDLRVSPLINAATSDPSPRGSRNDFNDFGDPSMGGGGGGSDPAAAIIEPDPMASVTGRSESNGLYDRRTARLTAIVASEQLDELLRALAATNFISVLEMDLAEVNAWEHLEEGYFYGSDHVLRVTLELECLYLREWTVPFMPKPIREALGIPDDPAPDA